MAEGKNKPILVVSLLVILAIMTYVSLNSHFKQQDTAELLSAVESELQQLHVTYNSIHQQDPTYQPRLKAAMDSLTLFKQLSDSLTEVARQRDFVYNETSSLYYTTIDTNNGLKTNKNEISQEIIKEENAIRFLEDEIEYIDLVDSLLVLATEQTEEAAKKIKSRNEVLTNIRLDLESRLITPLQLSEIKYDTSLARFAEVYLSDMADVISSPVYELFDSESPQPSSMSDVPINQDFVPLYETDILTIVRGHIVLTQQFNSRIADYVAILDNDIKKIAENTADVRESNEGLRQEIVQLKERLADLTTERGETEDHLDVALVLYDEHVKALHASTDGYNAEYSKQLELFEVIGELQLALIRQKNQTVIKDTEIISKK